MNEKGTAFVRYLAYAMEIVVVYVLGSTPGLMPEFYGAKPALLLCVALTAAIFEREIPAMIIGLCCGVLMDLGYSNGVGFFAIALTAVCFVVGYAANNLIVATFPNFLIYSFLSVGGLFFLYFVFTFLWGGVEDSWLYFTHHLVSRMAQTFICSIVFYLLNRLVYHTLGEES
jgi:rod shape-determining protein MreD